MADTKIVMSILNNEMLRGRFGEVMYQSRSTVRTWVEKKHTALLTSDSWLLMSLPCLCSRTTAATWALTCFQLGKRTKSLPAELLFPHWQTSNYMVSTIPEPFSDRTWCAHPTLAQLPSLSFPRSYLFSALCVSLGLAVKLSTLLTLQLLSPTSTCALNSLLLASPIHLCELLLAIHGSCPPTLCSLYPLIPHAHSAPFSQRQQFPLHF